VCLAVPDKRFCFDYFKPITTRGDLLAAYTDRRMRHTKKTAFDFFAYGVRNGGQHAWGQNTPGEFTFLTRFAEAKAAFDGHDESNAAPYIDFHAWHFTPASFELVILELGVLDVIDFHVAERFAPEGCEFIAVLRRGRPQFGPEEALQAQSLDLLRDTLMDAREQIAFLLAGGPAEKSLSETIARKLDEQSAYLREIAEVAAGMRKILRPLRAGWRLLLPIGRSVARLRDRA